MRNDTETIQQEKDAESVVIAGKVRKDVGQQIFQLMKKRGLNVNQFIGMVCEVLIRYASPDHNLTTDMEQAIGLFEHLSGWKNAVMLSDPSAHLHIDRALYFMSAEGRKGVVPRLVETPYFDQWRQTENIEKIYEEVMDLLMPERYRRMRELAVNMGARNQLEMIDILLDEHSNDADINELRQQFDDNDWSEHARKPADIPFKKRLHKSPDCIPDLFTNQND